MKEQEKILNSGILEQYVLGLLEEEEVQQLEADIERYPELKEQVKNLQQVMEQVSIQNEIKPPPRLRNRILDSIERSEQASTQTATSSARASSFRLLPLLAAIAAIGLVVLSFSFYQNHQRQSSKYASLQQRYQNLQENCERNNAIATAERSFLMNPNTAPIVLEGSSSTKAPEALVIVHFNSKAEKALLNIVNLPTPPADKQYQLWADVEGHMVSMGVFDGSSLSVLQEMNFVANAASLNITLEPLGGSEEATVEQLQASGKV